MKEQKCIGCDRQTPEDQIRGTLVGQPMCAECSDRWEMLTRTLAELGAGLGPDAPHMVHVKPKLGTRM